MSAPMFPLRPSAPATATRPGAVASPSQPQTQGHLSAIQLALPPTSAATVAGIVGTSSSPLALAGPSPSSLSASVPPGFQPPTTTTPNAAASASASASPSPPLLQDSDLFAQLARLKHVQVSLALDHTNSPAEATSPTGPAATGLPSISPFVAGLTSGSNSTAGATPAAAATPGSSRGTPRNPPAVADPSLDDAGVSPETAANKTKDRFAVKREQAAVMTAKLADLRTVMRDITSTARTLHSQAAATAAPAPAAAAPDTLGAPRPLPPSFLSPAAPVTPLLARAPAPLARAGQGNGLTGSPEMVSGLVGPAGGDWAARNAGRG